MQRAAAVVIERRSVRRKTRRQFVMQRVQSLVQSLQLRLGRFNRHGWYLA